MQDDMTPREVAAALGVTTRTVQRWIASGRLPATRVGGRVRVSRSSLGAVSVSHVAATHPIRSLLIANRGEIAVRVGRTARRMGIRVIGVHAADERAPDGLDEAHRIGSYLDGAAIIEVARRTGADAIHPGYGFLAENAEFARAVLQAGLRWVGPPPDAIAAMGDKAAARRHAADLGVPIVPGYDGAAQDDATLAAESERVGFPLLVKPSAGGGGKGMRLVRRAGDLLEALGAARREAQRSFGDERLILERYLEGSRHVELQVLFDAHAGGVHLGERDCSTQRRSQKVVEEAPAPSVTPDLRALMGEAAVRLAASVGYVSAGTVEMLLAGDDEFYFLEMNTRLQVEHPVTEAVTGRDLVADQLRIAGGATLAQLGLDDPPRIHGHAIEARLYAEDPDAGFLPATGRLVHVAWPAGVRIDTAVRTGDRVSERYDPMLAKMVVHAPARDEALAELRAALDATSLLGVRTNVRFLRWFVDQEPMRSGEVRTDTIDRLDAPTLGEPTEGAWSAAAAALVGDAGGVWDGGWRLNGNASVRLSSGGTERATVVSRPSSAAAVRDAESVHVELEGQSVEFRLAPPPTVEEAVRHAASAAEGAAALTAPMPGRVIAVRVAEGAPVEAHQAIVVIEAMKMEHAVVAPIDGIVASLLVVEGQQVQRGDRLGEVVAER